MSSSISAARKSLPEISREVGNAPGGATEPLELGGGIAVFHVRLDELKASDAPGGDSVGPLSLAKLGAVRYPVLSGDRIIRGVETLWRGEGANWDLGTIDESPLTKRISDIKKRISTDTGVGEKAIYMYSIRAMNLAFLGFRKDGKEFLVPLFDDELLKVKAGVVYPAKDVMPGVIRAAGQHNGQPS